MKRNRRLPPGWKAATLEQLVTFKSGGTPNKQDPRFWGGDLPWVTAKDLKTQFVYGAQDHLTPLGASKAKTVDAGVLLLLVRGMTLHRDIPVAITTTPVSFNQDVKALIPKDGVEPMYLLHCLQERKPFLLQSVEAAGHGTGRLNSDLLRSLPIQLPPPPEQRRVAQTLSTWDEAVHALACEIESKQVLLAGRRAVAIQRQSPPIVPLRDLARPLTVRNGKRYGREAVMGVLKNEGLVPMKEHVIAGDISRYLVAPPQSFSYNPMRINIGSIAMSSFDHPIIVSPDYVVFACNSDKLLPEFLNHVRKTRLWADFVGAAGNGSVRVRIYFETLADFEFPLPSLSEQQSIVEFLNDAEREIAILMSELEALKKQRDAVATELLTGRLRVPLAAASGS